MRSHQCVVSTVVRMASTKIILCNKFILRTKRWNNKLNAFRNEN